MEEQVKAGIKALLLCKKKLKKETLLDHDDMKVMLQISAIKVAPGGVKQTIKLPLPAPFADSAEVCLFVKDLKRGIRVDHDKSVRHWRDLLDEAGVTRVAEVIPLRQLKAEYNMYEARRKLCDAYDVFLSDVRVTRLLPTLLGKHFVTKKKQPVSINLEATDLSQEIDAALNTAYLHVHNSGACSTVQVGRCGQTEEQLAQNVLSAVDSLRHKFPGGWANIRSLHLKLDKSPAVPIHVSDVSANAVPVPAARRQPGSGRAPVVGELSTARAESEVIVDRFGNVQVVRKRPLSDDEEESDEEEERHTRQRRGKKRAPKQQAGKKAKSAAPAAQTPAAAGDGEDAQAPPAAGAEDGDSSDEEDRQLEAREAQFLSQLSADKAAAAQRKAAETAASAAAGATATAEKAPAQKGRGKKGAGAAAAGNAKKGAKKSGGVGRSPKTEKATPGKKYAKKTGKNIAAVKKVK